MIITGATDLRTPTVAPAAVTAKFSGTPLAGYETVFWTLAANYGVDPNWALAYLQFESAFGKAGVSTANPTNPWDILSYPGQWGQVGEHVPGNGYRYAVFASVEQGLEAGFRLWRSYAEAGYSSWFSSLSRALCGNPAGCEGSTWVDQVIAQGTYNATQWPYGGESFPPAPNPMPVPGGPGSGPVVVAPGRYNLVIDIQSIDLIPRQEPE
jgi:hypothetical protein